MLDLKTATEIARKLGDLRGNKTLMDYVQEIRNTDMKTLSDLLDMVNTQRKEK